MSQVKQWFTQHWRGSVLVLVAVALVAVVGGTWSLWLPRLRAQIARYQTSESSSSDEHDHDHGDHAHDDHDHSGHDHSGDDHAHDEAAATHDDHDHAGHSEETSLELSAAALRNIEYEPMTLALGDFERKVVLPAMVVERPGRSQIHVTAPLTGIVTAIYPVEGVAIEPLSKMFEIRLTHEELVAAQRDFLQTAESLDVVKREIDRLENISEAVIAGKRLLEQEYEQQKLLATLRAEQQGLLLHGLSQMQVDEIYRSRKLLQSLEVRAPGHDHDESDACGQEHLLHVQRLPVKLGEHVSAGQLLCVLADHCELQIEGRAFEDDADALRTAARNEWRVSAWTVSGGRDQTQIDDLEILYLADQVDPESRVLRFFVRLPNTMVFDRTTQAGRRYIGWRFTPGQRMEIQVPIERWHDKLVVPIEAVVDDGAESYVYQRNGSHFDRVAVHVEYRDQTSAVLDTDGSVKPGDTIAARGAYQMHLALKNKAGGGIDPHAGHQH